MHMVLKAVGVALEFSLQAASRREVMRVLKVSATSPSQLRGRLILVLTAVRLFEHTPLIANSDSRLMPRA